MSKQALLLLLFTSLSSGCEEKTYSSSSSMAGDPFGCFVLGHCLESEYVDVVAVDAEDEFPASTCQTSCDENASCQFFTLEASESGGLVCVLLAECSQFKYSSAKNEVSGRPTSSCGAPACYAEESRCSGVYLTTVEAESAEDCHERCRDMERKDAEDCDDEGGGLRSAAPCGAFTFDEESLLCTLSVSCDLQGGSCDSCVSGHVVCPVGGV